VVARFNVGTMVVMEDKLVVGLNTNTKLETNQMLIVQPLCIEGAKPSANKLELVVPLGDCALGIVGEDLVMWDN
jgi:hypothetical protein